MKKLHCVYLLFFLGVIYVTLSSHSVGQATGFNDDKTGAPGAGLCSSCHSGGAFGSTSVKIEVFTLGTSNLVFSYFGGTTYDVRITVNRSAGTPAGYGFEMTCLTTPGNSPLAGYSNLASNVKQKTVTVGAFSGRTYTEHNGVTSNNVFNMSWTAPSSGTGNVKFYASGNCVNGDGNDNGDLSGNSSLTLSEQLSPSVTGVVTGVSCFGGSNGAVNITVLNGTSPYSYNWGGGITSEDRTGLTAGNYFVTVTDNIGNTTTASFTVSEPVSALSVSGIKTDVSCFGGANGTIDISASGGTDPYSYDWGGGVTNEDRTSLGIGNYSVTVLDNNGCTSSASFNISQPLSALSVSAVTSNVSCFGANNGAINITASGGTQSYSYNWGGGITSDDRILLSPGNYFVTVTDNNSCTTSASFIITQPSTALSVSGATTNVSCNGENDGSIDITAAGGTTGYSYNWGSGITAEDRNLLSAGNYRVTVTDLNNCTTSSLFTVFQPPVLTIQHTEGAILCFGGNTTVNITSSGGTPPYSGTGSFVVQAGTGNYTVTDSKGCSTTTSIVITQPTQLTVNADTVTISCTGGSETITVSASGGTQPYTGTGGFAVNIPGTYNFPVTDANGCVANATGTALSLTGLSATGTIAGISCHDSCNAAITVNVSGGTQPYSFSWNNLLTTQNAENLCAGTYHQSITDASGCLLVNNYLVGDIPALQINFSKDSIYCFGDSSNISVTITGGTSPYNYTWNNGGITGNIKVPAGNYTLSVTDNHSCSISSGILITQPDSVDAEVLSVINDAGINSGAIDISVSGGTLPYNFDWSNGENTEDIFQLGQGLYSVTITDANGCGKNLENIIILSTGIEDEALNGIKIYPNPVSDKLFVRISLHLTEQPLLELMTIDGFVVRKERLEDGNNLVDISSLPPSLYLLAIRSGNQTFKYLILKAD